MSGTFTITAYAATQMLRSVRYAATLMLRSVWYQQPLRCYQHSLSASLRPANSLQTSLRPSLGSIPSLSGRRHFCPPSNSLLWPPVSPPPSSSSRRFAAPRSSSRCGIKCESRRAGTKCSEKAFDCAVYFRGTVPRRYPVLTPCVVVLRLVVRA